jgi:hypothetical protein
MVAKTSADRRAAGMNKWIVGLKLGIPAILIVVFAERYVNTGDMSDSSALCLLVSVCCLLSMADDIPRSRVGRWLLRSGWVAAFVGAAYVFFRGAWLREP